MTRLRKVMAVFLCLCMAIPLFSCQEPTAPCEIHRIVYGSSGEGRELVAYRLGEGENVMVLGFCIHGYEDAYPRDGQALVYTAGQVRQALAANPAVSVWDWSVYILPCLNPDGLYSGYTQDGPGRCTTTYIDEDGTLRKDGGIDLNRCFPARWEQRTDQRNRTGDTPLAAREAEAVSRFLQSVRGNGVNVFLDIHGWYFQTISTSLVIHSAAALYFPENTPTYSHGGPGYLSTYAASLGYESCLLEIPSVAKSYEEYIRAKYAERVTAFVEALLESQPLFTVSGVTNDEIWKN